MRSLVAALALCTGLSAGEAPDRPLARYEFIEIRMGMPFQIALYAPDEDSANAAARAAYARIKELNLIMSDYEPESELMQLCRTAGSGKAVPVSRDLMAALSKAQALSRRTQGAFDVTVGPLVKLWRKARRTKRLPSAEELAAARAVVGHEFVEIDEQAGTVKLLKAGVQLDLGGIAVGYAIDQALALLRERGIDRALIDASGDVGVGKAPPGKPGWRIDIAPLEPDAAPSRTIWLENAAVTTSGDAFQYVEVDGARYSHILDPRTGLGLTDRSSVPVVARDATTADSWATAVSVLGPERGIALVDETPGAAALIVRASDGTVETFESKRLPDYSAPPPTP